MMTFKNHPNNMNRTPQLPEGSANKGSYCKLIIALHCDLINI